MANGNTTEILKNINSKKLWITAAIDAGGFALILLSAWPVFDYIQIHISSILLLMGSVTAGYIGVQGFIDWRRNGTDDDYQNNESKEDDA